MAWQATQSAPNMQYYPSNPITYQNYSMAQGDAPVMPPNYNPQAGYQYMSPPVRDREPLIPQSFDGTPRMPAHYVQSQPLQPQFSSMPVQATVSAPMQSYYQSNTTNQTITDTSRTNNYMKLQSDLPIREVSSANTQPNYTNQASNSAITAGGVVSQNDPNTPLRQNAQESFSTAAVPQTLQSDVNAQQPQTVPSAGLLPPNPQMAHQPNVQETHSTTAVPQNVQSGTTFNVQQQQVFQPSQVQAGYHQPNPTVQAYNMMPQNVQSTTRFHQEPPVQQVSEMPQNTQVVSQQSQPSAYLPYDTKEQPTPNRDLQMIEEEER